MNPYNELILNPEDNKGLIVLPSGTKASETMVQAVGATSTYVERFHFNALILNAIPDYKRTFPGKVLVVSCRRRRRVQSSALGKISKWRKRSFKEAFRGHQM